MKKFFPIFFIVLLGASLRLFFIGKAPIMYDEPFYIFRSIGWIDFIGSDVQKTLIDLLSDIPWWGFLSFHDHPPLVFLINHLFYFFGDATKLWFARLPSAILGIFSIGLIYHIAGKLYNKRTAIIAACLFSTTALAVYFGRVAMMESAALFFILLCYAAFLAACENKKWWPVFGICVGLAFLTKYIAIFMIPAFMAFVFLFYKDQLKNKYIYAGILCTMIVCLPIIIFNYNLYKLTGHFDVQLASAFHQKTPEWTLLLGKEQRGTIGHRIFLFTDLFFFVSPIFSFMLVSSSLLFLYQFFKRTHSIADWLVLLSLVSLFAVLTLTGSSARFLFYTIPFFCLIIGKSLAPLAFLNKKVMYVVAFIFLSDIAYAANTFFLEKPIGKSSIAYSGSLRKKNDSTKYLDEYLTGKLAGLRSADMLHHKNAYAKRVAIDYKNKRPGKPVAVRLVYDPLSDITTFVWILHRRSFYEGWPLISYLGVYQLTSVPLTPENSEIQYIYIQSITDSDATTTVSIGQPPGEREKFHELLRAKGIVGENITNSLGEEKYRVYLFTQTIFS